MLGEHLGEGGEAFEGVGADEFREPAHADVVGALLRRLVGVVVDLGDVVDGDGVDRAAVPAGCFLGLVPKFGDAGDALDDGFGIGQ